MNSDRTIKVYNKIIIIKDVPEEYSDEELISWTKKRMLIDGLVKEGGVAS